MDTWSTHLSQPTLPARHPSYPPTTTPLHITLHLAPHHTHTFLTHAETPDAAGETPLQLAERLGEWDAYETIRLYLGGGGGSRRNSGVGETGTIERKEGGKKEGGEKSGKEGRGKGKNISAWWIDG